MGVKLVLVVPEQNPFAAGQVPSVGSSFSRYNIPS